jgi:hypothetical protein
MPTRQVSVFLENRKGRLAEVTKLLADEGINIRSLSLADMADFGVLRMIVSDRRRCLEVLKSHGLAAQETEVIAVQMEDHPGGLHQIVEILNAAAINIEYLYAFFKRSGASAIVVLKSDDAARAAESLRRSGLSILGDDELLEL